MRDVRDIKTRPKGGKHKMPAEIRAFLKRVDAIWRWRGNAHQRGQWLLRRGASRDAVLHLARRIALGKIQNPWSMQEIAHVITQNVNERRHAQRTKTAQVPKSAAPELLGEIFRRAGMNS